MSWSAWNSCIACTCLRIGDAPFSGDVVAQEINILASQLTLLHVEDQAILLKSLKNQVEMMQMLLCAGAADENIIQVTKSEVQPRQHLVHESLERLAGVVQSKWHPEKLPQPKQRHHRRLEYVSLLDWYLEVALPEIHLAEDAAAMQPGGEVLDVGQESGVVARFNWR